MAKAHSAPRPRELTSSELRAVMDPSDLGFSTTKDIKPLEGIIEQDRAMAALELGMAINKRNYNIYVAGLSGTGKTTVVKSLLKKIAPTRTTPPDWILVHNFKEGEVPIAISLPAGKGKKFKKDMEELIGEFRTEIPKAFHSKEHQERIQSILNESLDKENELFMQLAEWGQELGFSIKSTKSGIVTIPIYQERILSNKEYSELPVEERRKIEEERKKLDPYISDFLHNTREVELKTHKKIQKLQKKLGKQTVGKSITTLKRRYRSHDEVKQYLTALLEDILDNLQKFLPDESNPDDVNRAMRNPLLEYKINVLVDNSDLKGAPVVREINPTYQNLFGKIEKRVEQGIYFTDLTMIKAGSLLKANGGYLVLNAMDLFTKPFVWDHLKSVLRNRELAIEDISEYLGFLPTTGLKPQPIPVNLKLILIGSSQLYHLLYRFEEDFRKIFQVKADFDYELERENGTVEKYSRFIATTCKNEELLPVTKEGVAAIIERGSRLVSDKEKMSLKFNDISNLVIESDYLARRDGDDAITAKHVIESIRLREYRSSLVADKIEDSISKGDLIIQTEDQAIGQINGLGVFQIGEYMFGKPIRITAQTFAGKPGIINVEREAKLSGSFYDKGLLIIQGYLGSRFARKDPLSLSISVCFEQSYGNVDGDSASAAELFIIVSSMAEVPLRQDVAVTGSVDQMGQIQPIGGVNQKIEGFFDTCDKRGLTGTQGVMIPTRNVRNLMLCQRVIDAVEAGRFHIWPIATIEEGLHILTNMEVGSLGEDGTYPPESLYGRVMTNVARYRKKGKDKDDDKDSDDKMDDKPKKRSGDKKKKK